jgi:Protein of unknown function (DUF3421)
MSDEANQTALGLCVANYNGSLQPGKYLGDDKMCHFSYAGVEVLTSDFSHVIVRTRSMVPAGNLAFDFVAGQDTNGQPLYACRAQLFREDNDFSIQLGKYRRDFDSCHVSYGGFEMHGDNGGSLVDGLAY